MSVRNAFQIAKVILISYSLCLLWLSFVGPTDQEATMKMKSNLKEGTVGSTSRKEKLNEADTNGNDIITIVAISDTHGLHGDLELPEKGDLLIHCGDFAHRGSESDLLSFSAWLKEQTQFPEKIVISGNHDRDLRNPNRFSLKEYFSSEDGIQFLEDEATVCCGGKLSIYGASWKTCEADSFSLPPSLQVRQQNHRKQLAPTVDIFLSHVPAALPETDLKAWQWSSTLTKIIKSHRIPILINGHLHWGHGAVHVDYSEPGKGPDDSNTSFKPWFINASSKTSHSDTNRSVFPPIVIDYNVKEHRVVQVKGLSD